MKLKEKITAGTRKGKLRFRKALLLFPIILFLGIAFVSPVRAQFGGGPEPSFTLDSINGCTVTINVTGCSSSPCPFDWGDGTDPNANAVTQGTNTHTYSTNGNYFIDFWCFGEPCGSPSAINVPVTNCSGPPDTVPPVVTITDPPSNPFTTSSSSINVSGTVTDDSGTIAQIRGFVNGNPHPILMVFGGNTWNMSNVPLNPGSNQITVEAEDWAGNVGSDSLTVIYQADITPPSITITTPTSNPTYTTTTQPISLGGTASDDTGVTQVTWQDNYGNSGTASGTTAWTIPSIPLSHPTTVITVTAHDGAGNTGTDTLTVTYNPPDLEPPSLSITSPSSLPMFTVSSQVVSLSGTMSDDKGVTQVTWSDNHDNSGVAVITGPSSWSIPSLFLLPEPEQNIITVTAHDGTGKTGSDTITLIYTPAGVRSEGNLQVLSMDINFVYPYSPGMGAEMYEHLTKQVTVPRDATNLSALVHLEYSGTGHLTGYWKVDGQILSVVDLTLPEAGGIDIAYPQTAPPLPTYDSGPHDVTFDIIIPETTLTEPVITYFVETSSSTRPSGWRISLISPERDASIPLPHLTGNDLTLSWTKLPGQYTYRWKIFDAQSGDILLQGDVDDDDHALLNHEFSRAGFQPNREYKWIVEALSNGRSVAQSEVRSFFFVIPEEGGEVSIENFRLEVGQEKTLQPAGMRRTTGFGQAVQIVGSPGKVGEETGGEGGGEAPQTPEEETGVVDRIQVSEGDTVKISFTVVNGTTTMKNNLVVKIFLDGRENIIGTSFIPGLAAGEERKLFFSYTVEDSYNHTIEAVVSVVTPEEETSLVSMEGFLIGEGDSPPETHDTPPEEGYWIGEFNLKPLQESCTDIGGGKKKCSGRGTVSIEYLSTHEVDYTDITVDTSTGNVIEGQAVLSFPAGKEVEITGGFLTLTLDSITFTPQSALCSGSGTVTFPFTSKTFSLSFEDVKARPRGISGTLKVTNTVEMNIPYLPGFKLEIAEGSSLLLSQGNLVSSTLSGKFYLPENFLGMEGGARGYSFSNLTIDQGGATAEFDLPSSLLGGTNLKVSGTAVLDLSTFSSPGTAPSDFMGIYLKSCQLHIPGDLGIPDFSITGFYIDATGVTGSISSNDLDIRIEKSGFVLTVKSLTLSFLHNSLTDSKIAGQVTIPYIEKDFEYELVFDQDGITELAMATRQDKPFTIGEFLQITAKEGSEIQFSSSLIKADLDIRVNGLSRFPLPLRDIAFHLIIDSSGHVGVSQFSGGNISDFIDIGSSIPLKFGNIFPFNLEKMGVGLENSVLTFITSGKISLSDVIGLSGDTGGADMTISVSRNGFSVSDVNIEFNNWGVTFEGFVSWGSDRFSGRMEMGVAELFTATADITIGSESGVTYWKVLTDMALSGAGIPLGALPISIYGFNGGAYYNMAPQRNESTHRITGYDVSPGTFGFLAGADLGTNYDNGFTWNGSFFMEITAGHVGGNGETSGFIFAIRGDSYLFSSMTNRGSNKLTTELEMGYDEATYGGVFFRAAVGVTLDYHGVVKIPASGAGTAEAEILFSEDDWHIYIGTKESPISLKALYIFECAGYFDIDSGGIFLGFREGLNAEGSWWIFYAKLDAGISGDAGVGYNPFFVFGQVAAWLDLEVGVDVWLGRVTIFDAGVHANLGVRAPNPSKIWGSVAFHCRILGGLISGSVTVSFSWTIQGSSVGGGEGEIVLPLPVGTLTPGDGTSNVALAPELRARFPFPATIEQVYGGGIYYKIDNVDVRLYKVVNPGEHEQLVEVPSLPGSEGKGLSEDLMSCYFRPLNFLEENTTYEFRVEAHMYTKMGYDQPWEEYTRDDYRTLFTSRFTTGQISPVWNAYVESTYPKQGQKYVFTSSNVYVTFRAGIPDGYTSTFLKREGASWTELARTEFGAPPNRFALVNVGGGVNSAVTPGGGEMQVRSFAITWDTNHRKVVVHPYLSGGSLDPNSTYKFAIVKDSTGDEVYSLVFRTGSYRTFREMMEASPINARVGTGTIQGSAKNVEVRTIDFDSAEPIFWKDVESIEISPSILGQPTVSLWRDVYWAMEGEYDQSSSTVPNPHDVALQPGASGSSGGAPSCSDVSFSMQGGQCQFEADCRHYSCTGETHTQVLATPTVSVAPSFFDKQDTKNSIMLSLSFDADYSDFRVNTGANPGAALWTDVSILNTVIFDQEKPVVWNHIATIPSTFVVTITYRPVNDLSSLSERRASFSVHIPRDAFQVYIPLIEESSSGGTQGGGQAGSGGTGGSTSGGTGGPPTGGGTGTGGGGSGGGGSPGGQTQPK